MKAAPISRLITRRLSLYLRCLNLLEQAGVRTVSSRELADRLHLNPAQIRKDLACFGGFGVRGVGYAVGDLKRQIVQILGLDQPYNVVIVGAGNLGRALAGYRGFPEGGFHVVALADSSPGRLKELKGTLPPAVHVRDLPAVVRKHRANVAILAVPAAAGQEAFDRVYAAGIRAVLNFVPVRLRVPDDCEVVTVDLRTHLESLAHHLAGIEGRGARGAGTGERNEAPAEARTARG